MVRVKFKYKDAYTGDRWATQEGIYESVEECINWNGLGVDCEYEIVSVEEI